MTFGFFMLVASGLVWTITGAMISHPARHRIATVSLLAPLLLAPMALAVADLRLPAILGDNMVLQCDLPATIWGWAEAGEAISVSLAGQTGQGVAAADGGWRIVLPPLPAGGPFEMSVAGHDRELVARNILVGELWLASGQSNMAMGLSEKEVKDGAAEIATADFPRLRLFTAVGQPSPTPLADLQGRWLECSPATVKGFSAAAYFFGRSVHEALSVPVGLVVSAWPGSPAESWVSGDGLVAAPQLAPFAEQYKRTVAEHPERQAAHAEAMHAFKRQCETVEPYTLDAAGWEQAEVEDDGWEVLEQPTAWEKAGLFIDGVVFLRRRVSLPAAWAGRDLDLSLGPIEDDDVVWFNGVQVGASPPPQPFPLWPQPRCYRIPGELVAAGAATLAVRVTDRGGAGGMTGEADQLFMKPLGLPGNETISLAGPWRYRVAEWRHQRPAPPMPLNSPWLPTALYNGRIAPLTPLALRGILWYQGEANAWRAEQYRTLFPALINDWRRHWQRPDLPFLFVQLPNLRQPTNEPAESDWAELREAQAMALALPNTGMAVTIDVGEAGNIHPADKQTVGTRLARLALGQVYGREGVHSGPLFLEAVFAGPSVRLHFHHVGGGLVARGGPLGGFAIAGEDRHFVWAQARIDGDTVVLTSPAVAQPVAVRYAWACNPDTANLYNADGLPAAPFRTDKWPGLTTGRK